MGVADIPPARIPPLPDGEDERRRKEARRRRRMLEGKWDEDLLDHVRQFFNPVAVARFGCLDLSRNLFRSVSVQLATVHAEPPEVRHEEAPDLEPLDAALNAAGLWPLSNRSMRYTVGLREGIRRVDYAVGEGLVYRCVPNDHVWAEADPNCPDRPARLIEARLRVLGGRHGDGETWTWDYIDLRDGRAEYRVLLPAKNADEIDKAEDISEDVLGGDFTGVGYEWNVDGRPAMPYVVTHASRTGALWDPWEGRELVRGTLMTAGYWTFWGAALRDGAYPIRGLSNGTIRGGSLKGRGNEARVELHNDPGGLVYIEADGTGIPQALQWGPGCDPGQLQMAIDAYEQRTLIHAGLSPEDFQRSGSAESGYAISLKREAVREKHKALIPEAERADVELLGVSAALLNRHEMAGLPETGYSLRYRSVGLTSQERLLRIEEAERKLALGTASLVDVVLAENPGWTRDEASEHLERVRQERALHRPADEGRMIR